MPLQNRVTPFGEIVALAARGMTMGNRGILHNDHRRLVRPWQVRRWLACRLEFRGRHRVVMQPHRYTELFFLDEATALAAGHRPCAECRRDEYRRFRDLWASSVGGPANSEGIDLRLHRERLTDEGTKRTYRAELAGLPDGVLIVDDARAWLVLGRTLLAWSASGYAERRERTNDRDVEVLTPRSTVDVIAAGFPVEIHPSADAIAH